jgi:uncharacterized protein (TIGR03435 family)
MYPPGAVVAPGVQGFEQSPDGLRATHVALRGCLQWAYGIVDLNGPDWISNESYDILAKAAGPVSEADLREMMQKLLEERFQLRLRRETKISSVGVLVASKGGVKNLRAGETQGKLEIRREVGILYMKNATMVNVANVMASPLANMPIEKVIDDTGVSGTYDLALDFRDFDTKDPEFHSYSEMRAGLFDFASRTLERAYGLKLERRNVPVEFLIVEGGSRIPTPN